MMGAADLCFTIMLEWLKAFEHQEHTPIYEYEANKWTMKIFLMKNIISNQTYRVGTEFNLHCLETFAETEDDNEDGELPFDE